MQAVIMAGGLGTRLHPLTTTIPKPMVPLMNQPLIDHIVRLLKQYDVTEIIVMLFHQPETITNYLGDGSVYGIKITYFTPDVDLGTAGCVKFIESYLHDTFLVISGDLCTDANLVEFYQFHREHKSDATIYLTRVGNPLSYGIVMTDARHYITQFLEKPSWGEVFSDWINSGIYMFEPSVLKYIPNNREYDFGKDFFPRMLSEDITFVGYPGTAYWKDIGNLDEYLAVHQDVLSGKVKLQISGRRTGAVLITGKAFISDSAVFEGDVLVGDGVTIGEFAFIENSVIGNGAVIGKGARIINSVLWNDVHVGENSQTKNSAIASRTRIGRSSVVSDKVFIGEDVVIGDRSLIKPQVKIWPKKTIASDTILSTSLVWGDRWLHELFTDARISGIANIEITPEFAARLGSALGAAWGTGAAVYASRDNDRCSFMIASALQAGLISMGVNVEDTQVTPIPVVRQVLRGSSTVGGFHVRRSFRNPQSTDIIVFDSNGLDLTANKCKKVERLFFGENYSRVEPNNVGSRDIAVRPLDIYRKKFLEKIDADILKQSKLRVVIDFSFGPASMIFPGLIGDLGLDIVLLNAFVSTLHAQYHTKEQIPRLSAIVKSLDADIGFIIDPTCERLQLIDDNGRLFGNVELLAIITTLYLMHNCPKTIGIPINAPLVINRMAGGQGVNVVTCKSTHRSMIETAQGDGVGFVGGTQGGFIFTEFNYAADAMYAAVKALELMAKTGCPLSALIDSIEFPHIAAVDVSCLWEEKGKIMTALMVATEGMKRDLIHGIKVFDVPAGKDGTPNWVHFLPAKEEPLFTITAEAPTLAAAETIVSTWSQEIKQWQE